jgi:hypothetical protein
VAIVPRTVKQDSVEFVTAIITDLTGEDISGVGYQVAHVLDADKTDDPSTYAWEAPHAESSSPTPATRLVKKLVTGVLINEQKTKYRVFVKITDSPEVPIVDCGTYSIVP